MRYLVLLLLPSARPHIETRDIFFCYYCHWPGHIYKWEIFSFAIIAIGQATYKNYRYFLLLLLPYARPHIKMSDIFFCSCCHSPGHIKTWDIFFCYFCHWPGHILKQEIFSFAIIAIGQATYKNESYFFLLLLPFARLHIKMTDI